MGQNLKQHLRTSTSHCRPRRWDHTVLTDAALGPACPHPRAINSRRASPAVRCRFSAPPKGDKEGTLEEILNRPRVEHPSDFSGTVDVPRPRRSSCLRFKTLTLPCIETA